MTEITQERRNYIVLGTLITWIAQSSVGVLSIDEARNLLETLEGVNDDKLKKGLEDGLPG